MKHFEGVRIYNLFPNIAGRINDWKKLIPDIKEMGFTHIYLNPIFETGFSKNIYAPTNFYNFNSMFMDMNSEKDPKEQVIDFINYVHSQDMKIILEVIFTHTSIDSDLLMTNPEWFKYENGFVKKYSLKNNDRWVEWGDLAAIDNFNGSGKNGLWKYWHDLIEYYIEVGFDGFKAESAYRLPTELWESLIKHSKSKKKDVIFIGENLGATFHETMETARVGFDYIYTSLKWWDFSAQWFLEQHYEMRGLVKMISFPEYYNNERLALLHNKNQYASKAWYGLSALMNTGVMMCIGFEYGFTTKIDTLDYVDEKDETKNFDIRGYIKHINEIKQEFSIFNEEANIYLLNSLNQNILICKKISNEKKEEVLMIFNLDFLGEQHFYYDNIYSILKKEKIIDISPEGKRFEFITDKYYCTLKPGEVRILYGV